MSLHRQQPWALRGQAACRHWPLSCGSRQAQGRWAGGWRQGCTEGCRPRLVRPRPGRRSSPHSRTPGTQAPQHAPHQPPPAQGQGEGHTSSCSDQSPGPLGSSWGLGGIPRVWGCNPIWLKTAFYIQHKASSGDPLLLQQAASPARLWEASRLGPPTPAHPCLGSADPRPGVFPSKPSSVQAQRRPSGGWWTRETVYSSVLDTG